MNVFIMQNSIVRPLGRDMQNVLIGFVGEHEARTFFVRTRDDLTGYTISLVIDDVDCGAMTKAPMPDGSTMLSLTLTSDMLGRGGDKVCQLLMVKNTIVRKSSQFRAYVGASNDINSTAPDSATIIIISEKITELVHEAALDAIEEVQEVIDSIPADYSTLSAQVDANTEDIGGLKADLEDLDERVEALESGGGGSGLTDDVKTALMNLVNHLAWDDDDPTGQTYITALSNALYPPANLVSISAVYTQSGTVYDTDTIDSLKSSLVVTANYSDSTTSTLSDSDYTLSGTLTAGTSTITVTYGGKTTTFTVTVTANPYLAYWDFTQSLVDTINGYEFTLSCGSRGTLERTSEGLVFSCPDTGGYDANAQLPTGVSFPKGSKLTVEFGASDAQMTSHGGKTSGTTYGFGNGCLMGGTVASIYWRGAYDKFYSYESAWTDRWIATPPDYFNNKTLVIEVASDRTTTLTVDGVAFGTIPGSEALFNNKYTFMFGRKTTDGQTFNNIVIKKVYVETLSS